eukprot:Platyproteum_vivax@DN8287_c0_g1_i1.p1
MEEQERKIAPPVLSTPYQAVNLLRAFAIWPELREKVYFKISIGSDMTRESVRGTCQLPYGLGSERKLMVFCSEDETDEMLAEGADFVGLVHVEKVAKGWIGFDMCIATAEVMPQLMKIARVLGPRQMFPSPRSGTLVTNLKDAIHAIKSGRAVEFRATSSGDIVVPVGHTGFQVQHLVENMRFLTKEVIRAKPKQVAGEITGINEYMPKTPLRPSLRAEFYESLINVGSAKDSNKDQTYLIGGALQGGASPSIPIDPSWMDPVSTGWYR